MKVVREKNVFSREDVSIVGSKKGKRIKHIQQAGFLDGHPPYY